MTILKTKKDESVIDLEQHFILRMPPGPAEQLRKDVEEGVPTLKDTLFLEVQQDMRHGCVRYGSNLFKARLVDLPCIIETQKTTDYKTFYKCADISQMLICMSDDDSSGEDDDNKKAKDKEKKYNWNHGITPPLKNVRKRRFRKTLKKKHADQPDIEKEVKKLLRQDSEAIDVKWEVVIEEEKPSADGEAPESTEQVLAHGESNKDGKMTVANSNMPLEFDIFGEISDSSEDGDDVNVMDSEDESNMKIEDDSTVKSEGTKDESSLAESEDANELQRKLQELGQILDTFKDERLKLIEELKEASGESKDHLQRNLDEIINEETEKTKEFQILYSMLNQ